MGSSLKLPYPKLASSVAIVFYCAESPSHPSPFLSEDILSIKMADSGAELATSLPLSLRPWPKEDPNTDSFKDLIKPIIDKYGHFRLATEDALSLEINEQKGADPMEEVQEEEEESDDEDERAQVERIMKKKVKLNDMIASSVQGSGMLLESISALESKFLPKQGEHTMSPLLKEKIGSGKLTYDIWELAKTNEHEEQKLRLVGKGWNHEVLSTLTDDLLKAATRLNNEVKKETKYWEQVLSVTEKGWSVFKLPHGHGTLGVQLGATEAGPLFSPRGVAALRANDDGSIKLHRHITATPKAIRVRVCRDGIVTGTSRPSRFDTVIQSETTLEHLVSRARNSLFDQELYHEMALEARILGGYNVTLGDDAICINVDSTSQNGKSYDIMVDLVPLDNYLGAPSGTPADTKLADLVAVSLRLLLSHVYHQRLQQRSQPPAPLTERKPQAAPAIIIRPLLTYLLHRRATARIYTLLNRTAKVLRSAALPVEFSITHGSALEDLSDTISADKTQAAHDSTIQALLSVLIQPPQTTATFTLPSLAVEVENKGEAPGSGTSQNNYDNIKKESNMDDGQSRKVEDKTSKDPNDWTISIKVHTICAPPTFGVEYDITIPTSLKQAFFGLEKTTSSTQETHFLIRNASELAENFENMIAIDITHNIARAHFNRWNARGWEAEIRRSVLTNKGRRRELRWIMEIHNGRLTAYRQWRGERFKTPQYKWDGSHHEMKFVDGLRKFMQSTKEKPEETS